MKVVSGKLSPAKRRKIVRLVDRLIQEYEPNILALKKLHSSRSSRTLDRLNREIEGIAAANDVKLEKHSIQEIEQFFMPEERINKMGLAELLCQKHPVLRHELHKEHNNLNPYHIRMFEAVALGTMVEAKTKRMADCTLMAS